MGFFRLPLVSMKWSRENLILAFLILPAAAWAFNLSGINLALPHIAADFEIGAYKVGLVVTAFSLPWVTLMPLFGRLGDILGRKRAYLFGLVVFTIGSAITASAYRIDLLMVGCVLQGVGLSGQAPLAMATLPDVFPRHRLGRAMGIWYTSLPVAWSGGTILGGRLIDFLGWHSVFLAPLSIGIIGLCVLLLVVPELGGGHTSVRGFDWLGMVSFTGALTFLLLGLALMGAETHTVLNQRVLFIFGLLGLAIFGLIEASTETPFVSLHVLTDRTFFSASASAFLRVFVQAANLFVGVFFLQRILERSTSQAALLLGLHVAMVAASTPLGGYLADRLGARLPTTVGLGIVALSMALLATSVNYARLSWIAMLFILEGIGAGLSLTPFGKVVTTRFDRSRVGMATGVYSMLRESGNILAAPILGTLLQRGGLFSTVETNILSVERSGIWDAYIVLAVISCLAMLLALLVLEREPEAEEGAKWLS